MFSLIFRRKKSTALFFVLVLLLSGCGGTKNEPAASGKSTAAAGSSTSASAKPGESAKATAKGTAAHGEKSTAPSPTAASEASGSAAASASAAATATPSPTAAPTPSPSPSPSPTAQPVGTLVDGWIVGIPDYVPQFSYGSIDSKQSKIIQGSSGTDFMLCFQKVTKANVDAYAAVLASKGYTVSAAELVAGTYTLTASCKLKLGEATLIVTLTDSSGFLQYRLAVPV